MKVLVAQSCQTFCNPLDCSPPWDFCPWDFPGRNIGVGCHFLLQGILLTQRCNPGLLHCRQIFFFFYTICATRETQRIEYHTAKRVDNLQQHPMVWLNNWNIVFSGGLQAQKDEYLIVRCIYSINIKPGKFVPCAQKSWEGTVGQDWGWLKCWMGGWGWRG